MAVPLSNRFGPVCTMGGFALASSVLLFGWVGVIYSKAPQAGNFRLKLSPGRGVTELYATQGTLPPYHDDYLTL